MHTNALGSAIMSTLASGAPASDILFYPWGQAWQTTSNYDTHFAGMHAALQGSSLVDWTMYDAPHRFYASNLGRWHSPDPLAGDPANPQSLNRYSYVLNDPTTNSDPLGLWCFWFEHCGGAAFPGEAYSGFGSNWNEFDVLNIPVGPGLFGIPGLAGFNGTVVGYLPGTDLPIIDWEPIWNVGVLLGFTGNGNGWGGGAANNGTAQAQTPRQAATQYCQQHGQLSFNIPFTNVPVTVSLSATGGPVNFSSTNDVNAVVPVIPWPEWLALGAGFDITINAPTNPSSNPSVGFGKNLSVGYFTSPNGPQGLSLSFGPSIGPPINVSVPTNNLCGMANGGG